MYLQIPALKSFIIFIWEPLRLHFKINTLLFSPGPPPVDPAGSQPQRSVLHVFRGIRGRRHLAKALSLSLVSAASRSQVRTTSEYIRTPPLWRPSFKQGGVRPP